MSFEEQEVWLKIEDVCGWNVLRGTVLESEVESTSVWVVFDAFL